MSANLAAVAVAVLAAGLICCATPVRPVCAVDPSCNPAASGLPPADGHHAGSDDDSPQSAI